MIKIENLKVKIVQIDKSLPLPSYETPKSAGMDLRASLPEEFDFIAINPGEVKLIKTGIKIALPSMEVDNAVFEAQIRSRSGLALKSQVFVLNAPGTVDEDYRGEVGVILANFGDKPFIVNHGDRIAQMVFNIVERFDFEVVNTLDDTTRGEGGFGSTGTK